METKLWTKDFIFDCAICFIANLAYYITMVIITDYAVEKLGVSLGEAGFVCGIFILGALFARLYIGRSIEIIGMKKSLYGGMILFFIGTALNLATEGFWQISAVRFIQGVGFGVASTSTGAIMARFVPNSRRGEGISYYAMFVTAATAIGSYAGIYFYADGGLKANLIIGCMLLGIGIIAVKMLNVKEVKLTPEQIRGISGFSLKKFFEPKALPIAIITFFVSLGFASILGFITSFERELGFLE